MVINFALQAKKKKKQKNVNHGVQFCKVKQWSLKTGEMVWFSQDKILNKGDN